MQAYSHICKASRIDLRMQESTFICMSASYVHKLQLMHTEAQTKAILQHFQAYIIQNQS